MCDREPIFAAAESLNKPECHLYMAWVRDTDGHPEKEVFQGDSCACMRDILAGDPILTMIDCLWDHASDSTLLDMYHECTGHNPVDPPLHPPEMPPCAVNSCPPDHNLVGTNERGCGGHCEPVCVIIDCSPGHVLVGTDDRRCGGRCIATPTVEPVPPRPETIAAMSEVTEELRSYEGLFSKVLSDMVDHKRDTLSKGSCQAVSEAWLELCKDATTCDGNPRASELISYGEGGNGHLTVGDVCCQDAGWDDFHQRQSCRQGPAKRRIGIGGSLRIHTATMATAVTRAPVTFL
jgi:hypothetical protein